MLRIFLIISLLVTTLHGLAGQSWTIDVEPEGFSGEYLLLGYYLGNAQYVKDTSEVHDGIYRFSGDDTLHSGVYLVIFPPENQYFQLIVDGKDRHIWVKVRMDDISHPYQIKGSEESKRFYEYVALLQEKRPIADSLRRMLESTDDPEEKSALRQQLTEVSEYVRSYQHSMLKKYPNSLTSIIIGSNIEEEIPEFTGTDEEIQRQTFHFVKSHYFDHVPMKDPRIVRTPVLHQRIDYYMNKLTHQIPDSVAASVDYILSQFDPDSEAFRVYLVHFLNTYAKSNIVGMDAVYVHIAEKYYARGLATWTDEELLQKILKNAETLRPLLIGKTAPDLLMQDRENRKLRLHDIEAPYVVMFFWDPDCGHCKKSIPALKEFYQEFHPKGVEVFAICTSLQDEVPKCWNAVDERGMGEWVNVVDPYLRSRFKQIYDIRSTPQIYILDKEKKIVMKKIGTEQLAEVMNRLMENGS